jgi:hypothetical protein
MTSKISQLPFMLVKVDFNLCKKNWSIHFYVEGNSRKNLNYKSCNQWTSEVHCCYSDRVHCISRPSKEIALEIQPAQNDWKINLTLQAILFFQQKLQQLFKRLPEHLKLIVLNNFMFEKKSFRGKLTMTISQIVIYTKIVN